MVEILFLIPLLHHHHHHHHLTMISRRRVCASVCVCVSVCECLTLIQSCEIWEQTTESPGKGHPTARRLHDVSWPKSLLLVRGSAEERTPWSSWDTAHMKHNDEHQNRNSLAWQITHTHTAHTHSRLTHTRVRTLTLY